MDKTKEMELKKIKEVIEKDNLRVVSINVMEVEDLNYEYDSVDLVFVTEQSKSKYDLDEYSESLKLKISNEIDKVLESNLYSNIYISASLLEFEDDNKLNKKIFFIKADNNSTPK